MERPKRCNGTMYNGPDKRFARCDKCRRISYEKYEGDRCGLMPELWPTERIMREFEKWEGEN